MPGRDDHLPDRERRDIALAQRVDKHVRRSFAERLLLARGWAVDQRAVFGHDAVEEVEAREDPH
jgi:hypothetical protein